MKSHTVYKTFHIEQRRAFVRITDDVRRAVDESGIREGMALVSAMHITAGKLDLGPWQAVFYCEFDGRRSKRLIIKVLGE